MVKIILITTVAVSVYLILWQYALIRELRRTLRLKLTRTIIGNRKTSSGTNNKGKIITLPPYETLLHTEVVRRRNAVYVSNDTHRILQMILSKPSESRISMSAYVENIIIQHFEYYRDEINERHRQLINDNIL